MPRLSSEKIAKFISLFIPDDFKDNPFIKALLAGSTAIGILLATPVLAPAGVVGATGWIIVYIVAGGTFSLDIFTKAWKAWKNIGIEKQQEIDEKLRKLKEAQDSGIISSEEYKEKARKFLDEILK